MPGTPPGINKEIILNAHIARSIVIEHKLTIYKYCAIFFKSKGEKTM